MSFPPPRSEEATQRLQESRLAARMALEAVVAAANEAGWNTWEITDALVDAALHLKHAESADPGLADDLPIVDAVREQIGHGEQFD
ncbi:MULTISPECIES: hypothetical protein [Rhizobium]|uniref:Uncharacterized protein n=1 Tax=Rhizobium miluonense TaxID=411945 RepID=A0A1C3X1K1_9HYPH|nr:hypothetical protein [Rhizobium miluonense]SCB46111.1 hypothetical protein GA0061102_105138 [Rhizobium miluonense]